MLKKAARAAAFLLFETHRMPKWHEAASCNRALSRFESDPVLHRAYRSMVRTLVSRTSHRGSNPRTPASLKGFRVTVERMELIEAEFNEGVLRPMRPLPLRPGERVGIVVVRRPDPLRWDLARLSKAVRDEDTLTETGLAEWEATLSREDQD